MKDLLHFTRRERRGIAVLLLFCLGLLLAPQFYAFADQQNPTDFHLLQQAVAKWQAVQDSIKEAEKIDTILQTFNPNIADSLTLRQLGLSEHTVSTMLKFRAKGGRFLQAEDLQKIYSLSEQDYERIKDYVIINAGPVYASKRYPSAKKKRFKFDPNQATEEQLISLGVPKYCAKTLIKFREKGGLFYQKQDLLKVYGFPEKLYQELYPYIQLPNKRAALKIDINKASQEEWQQIRGIGPAISGRIVKFRDKLGGFSSIEQVGQTYGLPDSTFQKIQAQLSFSPVFRKIQINKVNKDMLQSHPLINWKQAQMLINYRIHHGPYQNGEEVAESMAFKPEELEALLPYLQFDVP